MPRTLDPALHTVRREAFLDAAQRLIQTKGYEAMSIQDVLEELNASRGAFYHYFDSKQALLEGVVDRFADGAMAALTPVLTDQRLPALRKMERLFTGIAAWKAERRELVLAIMEVWNSDSNAVVREKLRRMTVTRLTPLLSDAIRQGIDEGVVKTSFPDETSRALVALMHGLQEMAIEYFLAPPPGALAVMQRNVAAFTAAFERILGIPEGSLTLMEEPTLQLWFG
jgi:AcrR family transcriptional regulator